MDEKLLEDNSETRLVTIVSCFFAFIGATVFEQLATRHVPHVDSNLCWLVAGTIAAMGVACGVATYAPKVALAILAVAITGLCFSGMALYVLVTL